MKQSQADNRRPTIEYARPSDLRECPTNARIHERADILKVAASIREFGFTAPILVDDDMEIIAGHGRRAAAIELGLESVPYIRLSDLTPQQIRAYRIADNKTAEASRWDMELLIAEINELGRDDFNLTSLGFTLPQLERFMTQTDDAERDAMPEVDLSSVVGGDEVELGDVDESAEPAPEADKREPLYTVTEHGQVWQLGESRIICGDCTDAEVVATLLGDDTPDLLLTDPPYCANGAAGSVGTVARNEDGSRVQIKNDTLCADGYMDLMRGMLECSPALWSLIFTDWKMWGELKNVCESQGYGVRNMLVWNKLQNGTGYGFRPQHELVMMADKEVPQWDKSKYYGNVLTVPRAINEYHYTQKPVALLEQMIDCMSWVRGIYDPFLGSGGVILAAEKFGLPAYGCELEPRWCDNAVRRWQDATGQTAVCADSGKTLEELEEVARGRAS